MNAANAAKNPVNNPPGYPVVTVSFVTVYVADIVFLLYYGLLIGFCCPRFAMTTIPKFSLAIASRIAATGPFPTDPAAIAAPRAPRYISPNVIPISSVALAGIGILRLY